MEMRSIFTEAGQRGDSTQTAIQQAHKAHSFPIFFCKTKKMGRRRHVPSWYNVFSYRDLARRGEGTPPYVISVVFGSGTVKPVPYSELRQVAKF